VTHLTGGIMKNNLWLW